MTQALGTVATVEAFTRGPQTLDHTVQGFEV